MTFLYERNGYIGFDNASGVFVPHKKVTDLTAADRSFLDYSDTPNQEGPRAQVTIEQFVKNEKWQSIRGALLIAGAAVVLVLFVVWWKRRTK